MAETELDVAGISSFLEIRHVTAHTLRGRPFIFSADVALRALQRGMGAHEREPGNGAMIEFGAQPVVHSMTLFTGGRETGGGVTGRRGLLVVLRVTGVTLRRHGLVLGGGGALVARVAIHHRVRSYQRKAILVLLNLLNRHMPSLDRVALLAICA